MKHAVAVVLTGLLVVAISSGGAVAQGESGVVSRSGHARVCSHLTSAGHHALSTLAKSAASTPGAAELADVTWLSETEDVLADYQSTRIAVSDRLRLLVSERTGTREVSRAVIESVDDVCGPSEAVQRVAVRF
ncbi:hypothetical protein ACRAWC_07780 [Leifsonia sp. L25]|uniref:hypothetical protein n=1 Tax=Actinomycetes TaxID=1760 RepID=UPI003D69E232